MKHIQVGDVDIPGQVFLAPMAGFSDLPYRNICRQWGASYAVAEMTASKENLQRTKKTSLRMTLNEESEPRGIQLIGSVPEELAEAAMRVQAAGAQLVDFNCGCPARKVCSVACGSALMKQPELVGEILQKMVSAVTVPVTLKIRTGWDSSSLNALEIGKLAEDTGVKMLVIHGRTREQGFKGEAEYETARQLKNAVSIPVIVNGDINSGKKALDVLQYTGADGVMIGRAALGNPWLFKEINSILSGIEPQLLKRSDIEDTIINHMKEHYAFYGEMLGIRTIRKHLNQYVKRFSLNSDELQKIYLAKNAGEQIERTRDLLGSSRFSVNVFEE